MDALDRRGPGHRPVHQPRVSVGEDGLAGNPEGVDVDGRRAQPVAAASLVRQRAAMACGPRKGPHT